MKKNIVDFMNKCQNYQWVKYKHRKPSSLSRECLFLNTNKKNNCDFVVSLPKILRKYDSIWVIIIDWLIKFAYYSGTDGL